MAGWELGARGGRRQSTRRASHGRLVVAAVAVVASAVMPWPAQAATPSLVTQASASGFPVGVAIFDFATLSGGENPTGTITFDLYGPDNATCSGAPIFSSSKPVAGNGNYQSDSFTTTSAGTYRWIARYSGDANNTPVATACGDPAEQTIVAKKQPILSTQASLVGAGGQIHDTATLSSGAGPAGPTGTITFNLYGPNNLTCAGPPIFTSTVPVAGNGVYQSQPFVATQPGTYQWVALYSGDANNNAAGTLCADPAEAVVVPPTLIVPTLTTQASPGVALGGQVTDTATLAGGVAPTGTITFTLYGPNDPTCAGPPAFTNTKPVLGNGSVTSDPFIPTAAGTYRWRAAYSGDVAHQAVSTACNDPNETVTVTGGPGPGTPTLTTTASPGGPVGTPLTDTATLSGGTNPTGTITFALFGPDNPTCTGAPIFTNIKPASAGTVNSDPFIPTAPGTYRWVASYSGDANNNPVSTACGDPAETVVVTAGPGPGPVGLVTTASPGGPVGTPLTDTANLSGGTNPTGTITFTLFGPDNPTCTGTPIFTSVRPVAGAGSYTSDPFTPTAAGTYRWVASYSGDANNNPVATACNDPLETVVVTAGPTQPSIAVAKTATPASLPEPGGTFQFGVTVQNTGSQTVIITSMTDNVYGNVATQGTCTTAVVTVLPPQGTYSCEFPGTFTGNAGASQTDVVTVTATVQNGPSATASDSATVTITNAAPTVAVEKTATPGSLPAPGGDFTFGVTVRNTGGEPFTITSLNDDVYGTLATRGTCTTAVGTVVAASGTYSCQFTAPFSGAPGATQTDTVTAVVTDDEGTTATAFDAATVSIAAAAPQVQVDKSVAPLTLPEPGGTFTFTVVVTNPGTLPVTITSLVDDRHGNLATRPGSTCVTAIGTVVVPLVSYSCQFSAPFTGNAGATQTDTVAVTVSGPGGTTATATDSATVAITDLAPAIVVDKSVNPGSRPEPGGSFTFTVTVGNVSTEPLRLSSLVDSVHGNLNGRGTCAVGATLAAAGGAYTCEFTADVTGNAGTSQTDTVTATAVDDDGGTATGSDTATVTITGVAPSLAVANTVDPPSLPEQGGTFTHTVTVTNTGSEAVTIASLTDSVYGDLTVRPGSTCTTARGTVLQPGAAYTCTFTATFTGEGGATLTDVVQVSAIDDDGATGTASDPATVVLTDVPPRVGIDLSVSPSSRPEPGGTFTYTVTVRNLSNPEAVTITSLVSDLHGDLSGRGSCRTGVVLAAPPGAGSVFTCSFTVTFTGNADASQAPRVTVTVVDNEGTRATATSIAGQGAVVLTDVPPSITVTKAVLPQALLEPGGPVVFSISITNTGFEPVTLVSLVDDVFGELSGRPTCGTGVVIAPGASVTCVFPAILLGDAGTRHTDVVTATVVDDDGTTVGVRASAAVAISSLGDVLPNLLAAPGTIRATVAFTGPAVITPTRVAGLLLAAGSGLVALTSRRRPPARAGLNGRRNGRR